MLQNEIQVGDYILVTDGTSVARIHNFIGKVLRVTTVDPSGDSYPFQATDGNMEWWVNGIIPTELIKALV
jgi:hypothetical protein